MFIDKLEVLEMKKTRVNKKASMADVASAVGVSKTTISRYLHGEYAFMSEETKAKIEQVIKDLDYRPNKMAQSLKSDKSNMIGVSIADIGNPFSSLLLKGIQEECRKHDIQLLVSDANNSTEYEKENIEALLDAQVDGIIINTVGNNQDYLEQYMEKVNHKPMVLLDRIQYPLICDSITNNNYEVTKEMLKYLKEKQFSNIIFVTPENDGISTRSIRKQAVYDAIKEGMQGNIVIYHDDIDELEKLIKNMIKPEEKVCIFANNDEVVRDILEILERLSLTNIGICAFADKKWAKYSGSGITCIDQNPFHMGEVSAQKLLQRIQGDTSAYELIEIPGKLYIYRSTEL